MLPGCLVRQHPPGLPASPVKHAPSEPSPPRVQVHFAQEVVLVGNLPQLGGWRLKRAIRMSWSEGNVWSTTVDLPAGAAIEYKFAVQDPDL